MSRGANRSPQAEFMRITLDRYRAMEARFGPKLNKRGTVVRPGRQIPFTLEEYRAWMLRFLGGQPDGTGRCVYCGAWLTIRDLRTDHRRPPDRGGSLGFENLAPACDDCNMEKGGMTANAFVFLRECAAQLPEPDRVDLFSRLRSALKLAKLNNRQRARLAGPQPPKKEIAV